MLFDPRPKERREDLYGRERELQELLEALRGECPLILLLGVRRIGKTSLLKVALRESSQPYIYLDLRVLEEEGYSKVVLYRMLSEELSRLQSSWNRLRSWLGSVKGVEIAGVRVELDWGREGVRLGALIIGGGVPKHYLAQACQVSGKGLNYAVQVTMDRPEHGGVSGAPLSEAKSWGKLAKDAKAVTLICDATIALPIIAAALLDLITQEE